MYSDIIKKFNLEGARTEDMSPLALAFIGDGVYELVIRTKVISEVTGQVNKLNKLSSELAKAPTQAKMAHYLIDNELLSEDEIRVFKHGRNAKSANSAKNASIVDYRVATGFEALIGYLYIRQQQDRLLEIIEKGIKSLSE